jgi:hypothetical protein
MTSGGSLGIQGFRSLTQTFGETMAAVVRVAQRLGDTLKELDHKLQSLHLAHFVVGGWSSTKWIVPPRHVISHQRFVKQQSVLNLSLGFRYPCGPSWMNGRRRARVLPAPFPSDVFLTRVN